MTFRLSQIEFRGRITAAAAFLALFAQWGLGAVGLSDFDYRLRTIDHSLGNRVCSLLYLMILPCIFVWAASSFRVQYAILFSEPRSRLTSAVVGVIGFIVLAVSAFALFNRPYSENRLGLLDWKIQAGVSFGWLLAWWAFVFQRPKSDPGQVWKPA